MDVQASLLLAGAMDSALCKKVATREVLAPVSKTMVGIGRLKWICKDAFCVAGAVQETFSIRHVKRSGR